MKHSVLDLHLSSVKYADKKIYQLGHCQMVAWLISNFIIIKSEEVTYRDYLKKGNSIGIETYNEEVFINFKNQSHVE